ncbi:MAG TPA: guanylate kinase [Candidatus Coprosoma intestinipullorum]|uniref:Guanylate kinase n=1 Tax=Candidatus Coprosoma intestinipullorum TaxID=2840752 RepID=A0A9D0ZPL4_9FIRM|nr:guanylate kinase [Candidatus Coprosoma intestinipullorum]
MIKTKKQGLLIVLSGPSGSGKNTVCDMAKEVMPNIWESVSMTSRKPRKGEVDGKDYYFVSEEEFEKNIEEGKMLEHAKFAGNYYGTPRESVQKQLDAGKDVLLVIEIQGALQIKEKIPQALFVFLLPPSMKELKRRLRMRKTETEEKLMERFETAYKEINELPKYNYVIVNDKADEAARKLEAIINAEKCRVDRIEEVFLDTDEERLHEELVDKDLVNEPLDLK